MDEARKRLRAEARTHLAATVGRLIRKEELSLDELAERSEVDRGTIERVLRGEAEADLDLIYRLAGALEVEPRRLFDGIAWVPDEEGGGRLRVDPEGD
jgi:transcriptional regulator with XRE-family HTH domain